MSDPVALTAMPENVLDVEYSKSQEDKQQDSGFAEDGGGQKFDLEDQFDRLILHSGDCADIEELEEFGPKTKRPHSSSDGRDRDKESSATKRRHQSQSSDARPPPAPQTRSRTAHSNNKTVPSDQTNNKTVLPGQIINKTVLPDQTNNKTDLPDHTGHDPRRLRRTSEHAGVNGDMFQRTIQSPVSFAPYPGFEKQSFRFSCPNGLLPEPVFSLERSSQRFVDGAGSSSTVASMDSSSPTGREDIPTDVEPDGAPSWSGVDVHTIHKEDWISAATHAQSQPDVMAADMVTSSIPCASSPGKAAAGLKSRSVLSGMSGTQACNTSGIALHTLPSFSLWTQDLLGTEPRHRTVGESILPRATGPPPVRIGRGSREIGPPVTVQNGPNRNGQALRSPLVSVSDIGSVIGPPSVEIRREPQETGPPKMEQSCRPTRNEAAVRGPPVSVAEFVSLVGSLPTQLSASCTVTAGSGDPVAVGPPDVSVMRWSGMQGSGKPPGMNTAEHTGVQVTGGSSVMSVTGLTGVQMTGRPPEVSCMEPDFVQMTGRSPSMSTIRPTGVQTTSRPPEVSVKWQTGVQMTSGQYQMTIPYSTGSQLQNPVNDSSGNTHPTIAPNIREADVRHQSRASSTVSSSLLPQQSTTQEFTEGSEVYASNPPGALPASEQSRIWSSESLPIARCSSACSSSVGSSRGNGHSLGTESPHGSLMNLLTDRTPESAVPKIFPRMFWFPPTPDSDSQSTCGGGLSPRNPSTLLCGGSHTPDDTQPPTLLTSASSQSSSTVSLSASKPGESTEAVQISPLLPFNPAQTQFSNLNCGGQRTERLTPDNFLHGQKLPAPSFPHPTFIINSIDNDLEVRASSGALQQSSVLSDEVLNGVCDENGTWLVDEEGETFLHILSGYEDEVAVEALQRVSHRPGFACAINQYNRRSETPLYSAVCLKKPQLVELMQLLGADVGILCRLDTQAHTALHRAVEDGDKDMVKVLLRCPTININIAQCSNGCTAFVVALMRHNPSDPREDRYDIIRMMVDEEEKPLFSAVDRRSGKTALMLSVETKDERVVRLILDAVGVEDARQLVNLQTRAGNSALHLAAGLQGVPKELKRGMLKMLIKFGGDTEKKNSEGIMPKDWAGTDISLAGKMK